MHSRDLRRLESGVFDVTVIGGGIYGLWIAYEAAGRGLNVALIERGDFGGGVSFNHQKTAHGGLRSLQTGRLDRARESIVERRTLARVAPWFLRPLPFVVGTYSSLTRNRVALQAAFYLDAWLGADRNSGVPPELHLPSARLLSKSETQDMFPGIDTARLTGGAQWYDYQMDESERLTLAVAAAADRAGAILVNYVEATGVLRDGGRIAGVEALDHLSGARVDIRSAVSINAAGAQAGAVMRLFGVERTFPLLRAISLLTSKPAPLHALAAASKAGRMLTMVPWRGCALVGTGHSTELVPPGEDVSHGELNAFAGEVNEAFPALAMTLDDVTLVHRGAIPARPGSDSEPVLSSSASVIDHAAEGAPGAMSVIGVKYTTARAVAERAVGRAAARLGKSLRASRSASAPLPGGRPGDHEAAIAKHAGDRGVDLPAAAIERLARLHGERGTEVIELMTDDSCLRQTLTPDSAVTHGEVVHVIRTEMGVRLRDILMRRLALSDRRPAAAFVHACAAVAGSELGWSETQRDAEIADANRGYQIP